MNPTAELIAAIKASNVAHVEAAVKSGADVNELLGQRPLHRAVDVGNAEIVKLLIKLGANVNALDEHNDSPTAMAIYLNKVDMLRILLEAGATFPDPVERIDFENFDSSGMRQFIQDYEREHHANQRVLKIDIERMRQLADADAIKFLRSEFFRAIKEKIAKTTQQIELFCVLEMKEGVVFEGLLGWLGNSGAFQIKGACAGLSTIGALKAAKAAQKVLKVVRAKKNGAMPRQVHELSPDECAKLKELCDEVKKCLWDAEENIDSKILTYVRKGSPGI